MTDDEIKEAAQASELAALLDMGDGPIMAARWQEDVDLLPYLTRFAEIILAAERERCAKLCESLYPDANPNDCAGEIRKA